MITEDNTVFFSGWAIDKVLASGVASVTVPAAYGATVQVVSLASYGLTREPNAFVAISMDGGVTWYLSSSTPGSVRITTSSLYVVSNGLYAGPVLVKYYVFSSGVKTA